MPKDAVQLKGLIAQIREKDSFPEKSALVKQAVACAAALPPSVPLWLREAQHTNFGDWDVLLNELPKLLKTMYNKEKSQVAVFSADISTARMAYEAANRVFKCSLISALSQREEDFGEAQAAFLYIPPYERAERLFSCSQAVLLGPARFNSWQLRTVAGHLAPSREIALWDTDSVQTALAAAVRQNDAEQLDYLLARWEIGKAGAEKKNQLADILSFLEAVTECVSDEQ